jgi:homocysteine S-methyltransferase
MRRRAGEGRSPAASPGLDTGDPVELAGDYARLRARHPGITILGGCCGTDVRHVRAIADACLA